MAPRVLGAAFLLAVTGAMAWYARSIHWAEVWTALEAYPRWTLLAAGTVALATYAIYGVFDLLGRFYTNHALRPAHVVAVGFVSHTFNLNLGPWLGGIGMRLRLYSRLGLRKGLIARIFAFSVLTNWLGYLGVAGIVFAALPDSLPPQWHVPPPIVRLIGCALLLAAVAYPLACAAARRRHWKVPWLGFGAPTRRLALVQTLLASANWLLVAVVPWLLLRPAVSFPEVLATLLIAALAGAAAHIPAGLGVIEGVFLAALHDQVPGSTLIAALLAYRAAYYLGPLLVGAAMFFVVERAAARGARAAPPRHAAAHG